MLDANALAQAFAEALSGDALGMEGDNVATVTAASAIFRRIMVVFLKGQKYQRPASTIRSGVHPDKRENFALCTIFLMRETAVTLLRTPQRRGRRRSSHAATAQDPAGQLLQVLARLILGPMQQDVALVGL